VRLGPNFFVVLPDGGVRAGAAAARELLRRAALDPVLGDGPELEALGDGYVMASTPAREGAWLFFVADGLIRGAFWFSLVEDAVGAVPSGVSGSRPSQIVERAIWAFTIGDFGRLAAIVAPEAKATESQRGSVRDLLTTGISSLDLYDDYVARAGRIEDVADDLAAVELTISTRLDGREGRHLRWLICRTGGEQLCEVLVFTDRDAMRAELARRGVATSEEG
jgi:hypothetical protein